MLARGYTFTVWIEGEKAEPDWHEKVSKAYVDAGNELWSDKISYIIFQLERGSCGKLHWQGYVELKSPQRPGAVQKILLSRTAHIELRIGTRDQAKHYCMKPTTMKNSEGVDVLCTCKHCTGEGLRADDVDPHVYILGTWEKNKGQRTDLASITAEIVAGKPLCEVAAEYPTTYMNYEKKWIALKRGLIKPRDSNVGTEVHVLYGKSGVGKSRAAHELAKSLVGSNYYVMEDTEKGWVDDGYVGQKLIIIDEFRWVMKLNRFLRLIDRYEFKAETKGGFVQIAATIFIITSNYHPNEWYGPGGGSLLDHRMSEDKAALLRRCNHIVHVKEPELNP